MFRICDFGVFALFVVEHNKKTKYKILSRNFFGYAILVVYCPLCGRVNAKKKSLKKTSIAKMFRICDFGVFALFVVEYNKNARYKILSRKFFGYAILVVFLLSLGSIKC